MFHRGRLWRVWLTRLYRRFRHLVHELGKFGVVGGVAYGIDTAIFVLLVLHLESLTAKTVATVISASAAFLGNRFWTWRHRERSGLAREYGLYFGLNVIGLGIALGCLAVSHYGLGAFWPIFRTPLADVIAAQVVGLAAGSVFRFWSYRRFVFRRPTAPGYGPELAPAGSDRTGA
jgi:putative flippase GtrA